MKDSLAAATAAVLNAVETNFISGFLLVICFQVGLIALVAALLAKRLDRRQAQLSHLVWLSAIVLILLLIPIHLILGGWPVHLAASETAASGVAEAAAPAERDLTAVESAFHARSAFRPHDAPAMSIPRQSSTADDRFSIWRFAAIGLSGLYVLGGSVVLLRLVFGTARLNRWSRRGRELGSQAQSIAAHAAHEVGLRKLPGVRVVDSISMPLVLGLIRPLVLVPRDFESWSVDEQRATLLHELMHIRRGDLIGQWMAKWMRIIYWFHPASWYLDQRLMETREHATDQAVISAGMAADCYAECLLNIVSRIGRRPTSGCAQRTAIAMADSSAIEERLTRILVSVPDRALKARFVGLFSVAMLLLLTAVTTVRITPVMAQTMMAKSPPAVLTDEPGAAEPWPQGALTNEAVAEAEIALDGQGYDVSVPVTRAIDGTLTVMSRSGSILEGRVLIDGRPVAGATIFTARRIGEASFSNRQQAVSDEDGWYRVVFTRDMKIWIRGLTFPGQRSRVGPAYEVTPGASRRIRRDFEFLHGGHEIAGRVIDQHGNNITGARVEVLGTGDSSPHYWLGHRTDSQFETDDSGQFHLRKVPAGTYRLSVAPPRTDQQAGRGRWYPAMDGHGSLIRAEAGQSGVEIVLTPSTTVFQ